MKTLTVAWRNVGRNRRRSVLSIAAIAVATLSIVLLFSVLEGIKVDLTHNLTTFYTGEVRIRHPEYERYEHLAPLHLSIDDLETRLAQLDALPEVAVATPRLTVGGAVFQDSRRLPLQAVGVDFDRERRYSSIGRYVTAGDMERVTASRVEDRITPVIVGSRVPDRLGISLGDRFTVVARTAFGGTNAMTFEAAAVADFPVEGLNEIAFWAPLVRIQRLAGMPGQSGEILLRTGADTDEGAVVASIRRVAEGLHVQHWTDIETTYAFVVMAEQVYTVIGLFFFLLAGTVIVNTTMMVVFERRREIGTLAALGMRGGEIIRLFFTETLIIGFIGALIGLTIGVAIAYVLGYTGIDMGAAMEGVDFEISPSLYPVVNIRSSLFVFLFSITISALTSYIPTRTVARIEPVAALRED
ncbi:MAG: FtsX-like permease family protein [Spirochaetales bacterium]|nr:FtsX-like permease family protein [Spirochaetales bacterium]